MRLLSAFIYAPVCSLPDQSYSILPAASPLYTHSRQFLDSRGYSLHEYQKKNSISARRGNSDRSCQSQLRESLALLPGSFFSVPPIRGPLPMIQPENPAIPGTIRISQVFHQHMPARANPVANSHARGYISKIEKSLRGIREGFSMHISSLSSRRLLSRYEAVGRLLCLREMPARPLLLNCIASLCAACAQSRLDSCHTLC